MNTLKVRLAVSSALLVLSFGSACADHKEIRGRTGLPKVVEGRDSVVIEKGVVHLDTVGKQLAASQEFWLHYPGESRDTGMQHITVAIREDYFRGRDVHPAPPVTEAEAKGFTSFSVYIDGHRIQTLTEPWKINEKRDTATRWRTWDVAFMAGETRRMKILSHAPLGDEVDRKFVQFVSKDLGNWRGRPDCIEIFFSAPGKTEARLAGLEPRPRDINSRAVRWVYREKMPQRDIYVQLPPDYRAPGSAGTALMYRRFR